MTFHSTLAQSSTHAALLTAQGRGAIAVVGLRGPDANGALAAHFTPSAARAVESLEVDRIRYGRWHGAGGEEDVVVRRLQKREAGNDAWEICCHGGDAASRAILDDLATHGIEIVAWSVFTVDAQRAVPAATSFARTLPAALVLARQAPDLLQSFESRASVLRCAAERDALLEDIRRLLETARWGVHLIEPWSVAIAGPPNVGKSRLLNALAGYERAIVFDRPGTTRDVVTVLIGHDGWVWEVGDTAGIRDLDALPGTQDELEALGIARTHGRLLSADVRVLLFDGSQPWTATEQALLDAQSATLPDALVVFNKADLPPAAGPRPEGLAISAATGQGLDELRRAIHARMDVPAWSEMGDVVYAQATIEELKSLRIRLNAMGR